MKKFIKRTHNYQTVKDDLIFLLPNAQRMINFYQSSHIDQSFAEKIMLAVTSVNKCRYCQWLHTDLAITSGVDETVVHQIAEGILDTKISDEEKPAILYAIHFAETNRKPAAEKTADLYRFYGREKADDIILCIRAIFFANLSGNTFDALISRTKGYEVEHSQPVFELLFAIFGFAPLLAIAALSKSGINPLASLEHG